MPVRAPAFPPLDWLHTPDGRPVTLADLRGRVVVLDVWTAGCINCLHLLPQLHDAARRLPPDVVFLGVHSGKFPAERRPERLAAACARLGVHHPVANDRQFRAWREWAVRGWPTVAVLDPRGYVVHQQAGELRADAVVALVTRERDAARADGTLDLAPRWLDAAHGEPSAADASTGASLRFPEGVAVSTDAATVRAVSAPGSADVELPADAPVACAVADTAHHRLLLGLLHRRTARLVVTRVVGRTGRTTTDVARDAACFRDPADAASPVATPDAFRARADGPADVATFDAPRGIAFGRDADGRPVLWVAGAGNHALRAVDLATGTVRTVAGTGARAMGAAERAAGALASPWAVSVRRAPAGDVVDVAMAGTHQLWTHDVRTGRTAPSVGGRGEALRDGSAPDALLAQPMAVVASPDGARVWWADAESSALRTLAVARADADDAVGTLVGTGLFEFGDADGVGDAVRLQHPQGLALAPDGRLLVADTYNDALKWCEPATRTVTTLARGLHGPTALAVVGAGPDAVALVCDTDASRLVLVRLADGEARVVRIDLVGASR